MAYEKTAIYFMSGTGNSLRVARRLADGAEKFGSDAEVVSAMDRVASEDIKNEKNNLLAFVFPAHGFTAPWHMLKFVSRLPRGKADAVCVATRGSFKFGSVFVPGMSGSGTFIIALILFFKGCNVRGLLSVNMPSNWFSLHPIQSKINHEAIAAAAEEKVTGFVEKIFVGKKVWLTLNNLYELTGGILLSLISLGYLLFGRFFLAKLFFAGGNCNGCGICAWNCSFDAIKMWGKKNPKPFWKYSCESCMRCSAICPQKAIEAGQSWAVLLFFISTIPLSLYIISALDAIVPGMADLNGSWGGYVLKRLCFYPALFIPYYLFHVLMRLSAVNWLFTHTTMTRFPFWGRYREPNTNLMKIDKNRNGGTNL